HGSSMFPDIETGVFCEQQTPAHLRSAIERFEAKENTFSPAAIRNHVLKFDVSKFKMRMSEFIRVALARQRGIGAAYLEEQVAIRPREMAAHEPSISRTVF